MIKRRLKMSLTVPLVLLIAALACSGASAQSRGLDDAQFIQGLRERGMKELLLYFMDRNPPADPVSRQEIAIERHKFYFEDDSQPEDVRRSAALDVLKAYRELFEIAPRMHEKGPIWRVDFAVYVLRVILPGLYINAGEFVEFGVATKEQQQAFDELIGEALRVTEEAGDIMFRLEGDLPRRDDFETNFVNTGFWQTLKQTYGELQLPFYRAWVLYYGSLMSKPAGNLREALGLLNSMDRRSISDANTADLLTLRARIHIGLKQYDEALKDLGEALKIEGISPMQRLIATLAQSEALARTNKAAPAVQQLERIRKDKAIVANPMLLLLTYDRQFQITNDYGVYTKLFEDPAARPWKSQIQGYVSKRFAVEDSRDLSGEAPMVVLSSVDLIREKVQQFKKLAEQESNASRKENLLNEAGTHLQRAYAALDELLKRENLAEDMKAQALFKLGIVEYERNQPLQAAQLWLRLAEQMPQRPEAENAAANGFAMAQAIYRANRDKKPIVDLFDRAQTILLTKYPHTEQARQHWYTRGGFLREQRRFAQAVEAYEKVTPDHPYYVDALYELAVARHARWLEQVGKEKDRFAKLVIDDVDKALQLLGPAIAKARGERAESLLRKQGDALLIKGEVLVESTGDAAAAQALMKDFDSKYGRFHDLIGTKRQLLIGILLRQNQESQALEEIKKFIQEFPDEGGPLVKSVLDSLNRQVESLKQTNPSRATELAKVGVNLAEFLLEWAKNQPQFQQDPAQLLAVQVILGDQYLAADRPADAIPIFDSLYESELGANNLQVVYGKARAHFEAGQYDGAEPALNKILRLTTDRSSSIYWDCWVMRLTIKDKQYEKAKTDGETAKMQELSNLIFTSIGKLTLNEEDDLGGPRFKTALEQLQRKHFPQ